MNFFTWGFECECEECIDGFPTKEHAERAHQEHAATKSEYGWGHDLLDTYKVAQDGAK